MPHTTERRNYRNMTTSLSIQYFTFFYHTHGGGGGGGHLNILSVSNNNNIGHLYCAVPILIYSTAHYIITDILLPRL